MTIDLLGPQLARRRRNPVAIAATLAGSVVTFISLAAMSWYSVNGPYVVNRTVVLDGSKHQFVSLGGPEMPFLVDPDMGSQHSWIVWAVFALCAIAAATVCVWSAAPPMLNIVAITLAAVLCASAVVRVIVAPDIVLNALADDSAVPPGTHLVIHAGFWTTLVGLALIAAGSAAGLRRDAPTPQSRRVPV